MSEIRFYHLTRSPLDRALPQLLEKTLRRDWRAVVIAGGEERVESLNASLWTYDGRDEAAVTGVCERWSACKGRRLSHLTGSRQTGEGKRRASVQRFDGMARR